MDKKKTWKLIKLEERLISKKKEKEEEDLLAINATARSINFPNNRSGEEER